MLVHIFAYLSCQTNPTISGLCVKTKMSNRTLAYSFDAITWNGLNISLSVSIRRLCLRSAQLPYAANWKQAFSMVFHSKCDVVLASTSQSSYCIHVLKWALRYVHQYESWLIFQLLYADGWVALKGKAKHASPLELSWKWYTKIPHT